MCPLVRNSECMEKFHILQRDVPSQTLPIAGRLAQKRPRRSTAGVAPDLADGISARVSAIDAGGVNPSQ
jgi:hypothetical protein